MRYRNIKGKNLRGLYIIKSETDKLRMKHLGSVFTNYNYAITDIKQVEKGAKKTILSVKSNFKIEIDREEKSPCLPTDSPFTDWKEARRFAGPLPFTFSYNQHKKEVLIIEGVRSNWKPKPVKIEEYSTAFFKERGLSNVKLASAFEVQNIPYYWKKGKKEQWE